MPTGHEVGFGLLPNSAIDQHVIVRHREPDLEEVVLSHPGLLGIGIDEGAAIVVHGDTFDVIGNSRVVVHDGKHPFYFLSPGQRFNLRTLAVESRSQASLPAEASAPSTIPNSGGAASTQKLMVASRPDAADIEVDGVFMGSTPSLLELSTGEHDLVIRKGGYKLWQRKLRLAGGEIKINAELEEK